MIALRLFLWMTLVTGVAYPLLITGIAQIAMRHKANGSFIEGTGSALIGQKFEDPKNFWGRPSAVDYNPIPSGGSNLGPISQKLKEAAAKRAEKIGADAPNELLFASASGLDPHISPEAARFQIDRIIKARGLSEETARPALEALIIKNTQARTFGFLGEPVVNVLELNIGLKNE